MRIATIQRDTAETKIGVTLNLDGSGAATLAEMEALWVQAKHEERGS